MWSEHFSPNQEQFHIKEVNDIFKYTSDIFIDALIGFYELI